MIARSLLQEGSGKKIFEDESPDYVILEFKDHVIDEKTGSKKKVKNKGEINSALAVNFFEYLNCYNIRNHFAKKSNEKEIKAKKLDMIPIEVLIRNHATGKFSRKYGFKNGEPLNSPVLEFYLKDEKLKKPSIVETLIYAMGLATKEEILSVIKLACKTNAILKSFFERRSLKLVDIQMEFGRSNGKIFLGDEISLDTCTLIELDNNNSNHSSLNTFYKNMYERIIGDTH